MSCNSLLFSSCHLEWKVIFVHEFSIGMFKRTKGSKITTWNTGILDSSSKSQKRPKKRQKQPCDSHKTRDCGPEWCSTEFLLCVTNISVLALLQLQARVSNRVIRFLPTSHTSANGPVRIPRRRGYIWPREHENDISDCDCDCDCHG